MCLNYFIDLIFAVCRLKVNRRICIDTLEIWDPK